MIVMIDDERQMIKLLKYDIMNIINADLISRTIFIFYFQLIRVSCKSDQQ